MKVLLAVAEDLFKFACDAIFGTSLDSNKKNELRYVQQPQSLALPIAKHLLPSSTSKKAFTPGEQYFIAGTDVYMYKDPVCTFDNALRKLKYGQNVRLIDLQGRWAQIRLAGVLGWVLKDALALQASDVYPQFQSGVQYDAYNTQTIKLRACIDDMFHGGKSNHILSAAEYAQYKLEQKKIFIDWDDIRLRIPGTWQRKLRGRYGIHIGIYPKQHAVMEYIVDDIGHLAFVESVFPDGSIIISEIGAGDDAYYTQQTLKTEQYRELRPVFIEVV